MTVRHLLTMTSGKNPSLLLDKTKDRWIKDFFNAPWISEPGEMFLYVSENIYMLCAILVRVTGISVTEFLTPRLYEPLGIPVPYWETDHHGVEVGGWGLMLPVEDFAKFTLCYAQNGVYEGKQVIPARWVQEATSVHSDNSANRDLDASAGYGYCFWQCGGAKTHTDRMECSPSSALFSKITMRSWSSTVPKSASKKHGIASGGISPAYSSRKEKCRTLPLWI